MTLTRKNSFKFLDLRKDIRIGLQRIQKLLAWTIVKDYHFVISEHFVERCLERNFPLAFILNLSYIALSEYRFLFREEGSYLFRCNNDYLVFVSTQNEFGNRKIILKTAFEANGKTIPGIITSVSRKNIMEIKL